MTTYIGLLRGINVGGANRLAMAQLRAAAETCGFRQVATYVQSGNIVFASEDAEEEVAAALAAQVAAVSGLKIPVMVRSRDELAAVVAGNPFPAAVTEPATLHVTFFREGDQLHGLTTLASGEFAPEAFAARGRNLYLHVPAGLGRSKLAITLARAAPGGTTRNWRTVTALLTMAEAVK